MTAIQSHHTPVRSWSHIRSIIQDAVDIERTWQATRPDGTALITPFMPFQVFDFISLLAEALPEAPGGKFLDVGCGPGSKMLIASGLFGLDVRGFEISQPMVDYARGIGLNVEQADAMDYDHYQDADIIWFNKVFHGIGAQAKLESRVWAQTRPGATVIGANLSARPPSNWFVVLDDFEVRRGIWSKPMPQG